MATPWNPNDPEVVGPEFIPEITRSWTIGSTGGATTAVSQRFRSTAAEADPDLELYATAVTGDGYLLAEVMEDDGTDTFPVLANVALSAIKPTAATFAVNFRNQAGSTVAANLVASIDDTTDPANDADYVHQVTIGAEQALDLQFDGAQITAALAGKRILGVAVGVRAMPTNASDATDLYEVMLVEDPGTGATLVRKVPRLVSANREAWFNFGEVFQHSLDPTQDQVWTEALLDRLASGGDMMVRIYSGGQNIKFSRVRLIIATADENRDGLALFSERSWELTDTEQGNEPGVWSDPVALSTPDMTAGWAKAAATTYRIFYRRAFTGILGHTNTLNVTMPVLSRHDSAGPAAATFLGDPMLVAATEVVGPTAALNPATQAVAPGVTASAVGAPTGGANQPSGLLPVRLLVAGVDSVDGQPYTRVMALTVDADSGPVEQFVTTGAGGDYTAVRVAVGLAASVDPNAALTVTIKNAAGTVTLGSGSITAAALKALPGFLAPGLLGEVTVEIGVTLAAATQYRIQLDTAASNAGWLVGVYTSRGGDGQEVDWPDGAASYGGATDYAFGHAGISAVALCDDLAGHLVEALTGPDGFAVVADVLAFNQAEPGGIGGVPFAQLAWTGTALGADFVRYQLQRRDTVDDEWADVAYLTAEAIAGFADMEARLVVASEWRIRVVGANGTVSLWTDPVTLALAATGCGLTFSTNWLPLDAVAYGESFSGSSVRDYEFPDAAEALVRRFAGRDDFVVFRPTERRSVRFRRWLLVRAYEGGTGIIGPDAYDTLRELSRGELGDIPYLAVRDEQGNRWFAAVLVSAATVQEPGDHHLGLVDVVPVGRVPVAPTIEG